jgi:hypothetical protein
MLNSPKIKMPQLPLGLLSMAQTETEQNFADLLNEFKKMQ